MNQYVKVLDKVVLVHLDVKEWTGRKNLRPKDLMASGGSVNLPPETLASLGHKKTIDPKALSVFGALKKKMERACSEVGTRFLGGYAIPENEFDDLASKLDDACKEAEQAKANLLQKYDNLVEEWISKNSSWEHIIRQEVVPKSHVSDRIRFNWNAFRISPVDGDSESPVDQRLQKQAEGLGEQLFSEIATAASSTYKRTYEGRSTVGQKAVRPVRSLHKKLKSLVFVDRRVQPILDEIESVLEKLPKTGNIEGNDLLALRGLVALLASKDAMQSAAEKASNGAETVEEPDESDSDAEQAPKEAFAETEPQAQEQEAAESEPQAQEPEQEEPAQSEPEPEPESESAPSGWFFG